MTLDGAVAKLEMVVDSLNKSVESLHRAANEIKSDVGGLTTEVSSLARALRGDADEGNTGILQRVRKLESKMDRVDRAVWLALGAGFAGGGLVELGRMVFG